MRRFTVTVICALAALAALAPAAARPATGDPVVRAGFVDRTVAGAGGLSYRLRIRLALPRSWHVAGSIQATRFGPVGNCRHRGRLTARVVADAAPDADGAARVARKLTGARRVDDRGVRNSSAWQVVRSGGRDEVRALLVRPAPNLLGRGPIGARVWIELSATATAQPGRECHSGGPRSVAAGLGDMLATAELGGFALGS